MWGQAGSACPVSWGAQAGRDVGGEIWPLVRGPVWMRSMSLPLSCRLLLLLYASEASSLILLVNLLVLTPALCLRQNPQSQEGLGRARCQSHLRPAQPPSLRLRPDQEKRDQRAPAVTAAGPGESQGLLPGGERSVGRVPRCPGFLRGPGGEGSVAVSLEPVPAELPRSSLPRDQRCCQARSCRGRRRSGSRWPAARRAWGRSC